MKGTTKSVTARSSCYVSILVAHLGELVLTDFRDFGGSIEGRRGAVDGFIIDCHDA